MLLSSAEKLSDFNALSRAGGAILTFEQVFSKWCIRQVERNFLGGGWFTEERRSAEDLEP
jgi:hypothetical protein